MDDDLTEPAARVLRGTDLRYFLTYHLHRFGSRSIAELVEAAAGAGFALAGRPGKAISDALRWEIRRGRVRRVGHGVYGPGSMPRATEYRIQRRILALQSSG